LRFLKSILPPTPGILKLTKNNVNYIKDYFYYDEPKAQRIHIVTRVTCVVAARLKRSATNSDDQLSDSQQQSTPAQKKPRVFFSEQQKAALRDAFQRDSYPNQTTLERLASELGVGTKTVVNWFHNHRMRAKQQQVILCQFFHTWSKVYRITNTNVFSLTCIWFNLP